MSGESGASAGGGTTGGAAVGGDAGAGAAAGAVTQGGAAGAGAGAQATGGETAGAAGGSGTTPAAFTPNLKYKVQDAEKDFPDWAKPLITNADMEKNLRDLFTAGDGIGEVKQSRDFLKNENTQLRTEYARLAPLEQNVNTVLGHLQKRDYDSFFSSLNIPRDDILRYALDIVKKAGQPGALEQHDAVVAERQRASQLELQNRTLQQQIEQAQNFGQQQMVQQLDQQIGNELASTGVAPVVQAYDAKFGAGAFRKEVVRRGQAYDAAGQEVPPRQVVAELVGMLSWQGGPTAAPANGGEGAGAAGAGAGALGQGAGGPIPTLPNIRSKGGSPVKTPVKGLDGMRQRARELQSVGR